MSYVVFDRRRGSPQTLAELRADPRLVPVYADPHDLAAKYAQVVIFRRSG